jgi:hypothetical protein
LIQWQIFSLDHTAKMCDYHPSMQDNSLNSTPEIWVTPSFEEVEANMECTAYSSESEADEFIR